MECEKKYVGSILSVWLSDLMDFTATLALQNVDLFVSFKTIKCCKKDVAGL